MSNRFFDKLLNIIGLEENILEEVEETTVEDMPVKSQDELIEPNFQTRGKKGKVVNIHTSSYVKVVVYQPLGPYLPPHPLT
jgi:hypothetical protein